MPQWLRVLGPGFDFGTCMSAHKQLIMAVSEDLLPFPGLCGYCIFVVHIFTCRQNKIKNYF